MKITKRQLRRIIREERRRMLNEGMGVDLEKILADHHLWVESGGKNGERANLTRADLSDAKLSGAVLYGANLTGAIMPDDYKE